jgi:DNA-binding transcriptional MerR regulator
MLNNTPAYNLKVVLKETGLAADTLRAWERRYGLPVPQRTEGGHRLYSQYDIATIKWLMARQAEGLSISRAVDLWNEQRASGVDPLVDSVASVPLTLTIASPDTSLDNARAKWIEACQDFNETLAEQTLNQAFALFPVEDVCVEVLQKGLSEIGTLWYENKASVQQEHFASHLAMRRLDALLIASPAPAHKQKILVGCPADEWHTFTSLLLALLLRRRGYSVIYLGANVPIARFEETVHAVNADLVILVAQTLISAASLQRTALALANKKINVAYGGRILNLHPELASLIPGHHLGNNIRGAFAEVENILSGNRKAARLKSASPEHLAAHQFFTSKRADIEHTLRTSVEPLHISTEDYQTSIHFLGDNITAALQLGNMQYVSSEVDWINLLLKAYNHPTAELLGFIHAYAQAVDKHINGTGRPIYDWLNEEAAKLKESYG